MQATRFRGTSQARQKTRHHDQHRKRPTPSNNNIHYNNIQQRATTKGNSNSTYKMRSRQWPRGPHTTRLDGTSQATQHGVGSARDV
jgi:hypothetical protein